MDPGVEATIRWQDVIRNGLPAGEAIDVTARVRYDDEREDDIVAEELKVRAAPAFANSISGTAVRARRHARPSLRSAAAAR